MSARRELAAFFAPYVNSYKRYQAGSWAPTGIAWSYDNRTAGFRVVGNGPSLRIECRIPGADANPYLAFAAALAAGLDGIANKVEPPAIFDGDVYQAKDLAAGARHPARRHRDLFETSDFVRRQPSAPRGRALPPLLPHRAAEVRRRGHRLGAGAVLRAG